MQDAKQNIEERAKNWCLHLGATWQLPMCTSPNPGNWDSSFVSEGEENDLTCPVKKSVQVSNYQTIADALEFPLTMAICSLACSHGIKREVGRTRYSGLLRVTVWWFRSALPLDYKSNFCHSRLPHPAQVNHKHPPEDEHTLGHKNEIVTPGDTQCWHQGLG